MSGRGTFSGTVFQATVGACAAGLLLAERPLFRLGSNLPGTPRRVLLETLRAIDDVHIITDTGEIFVQAKNNLTLSPRPDSELASVADQFVRQYREGAQENGERRDLTPARDRLVLAVGEEAPATVTGNLRAALERNRTGHATGLPTTIAEALQVFTTQVETAWLVVVGTSLAPVERQALLALCSVVVIGDSQRQVVEEVLRAVVATPGAETTLFDLLFTWASDAAQRGTGGDAAAIRLALQGRISLAAPPSFQQDLERLQAYSAGTLRQLERFTGLQAPEGLVRFARPVVVRMVEAARLGTLALTGDPGAGKSAVLFALAGELQLRHPVVCLSVEPGASTLDLLRAEIGLRYPLVDVLRHLPRSTTAYLLLDALDASRGGTAEVTYRKLIEAVKGLPGWQVVASVRSFDLRLGVEWQRLFRGAAPFAEYADASFPMVQHLHLGLLTTAERADLARQSPSLDAALTAGGAKLETLAHNPFNLALLAELLTSGTLPQDLMAVTTRGQLLAQYWYQRVETLGTPAVVALAKLVELMLQAKALTVPQVRVEAATAEALDLLQRTGVLVRASSGHIGFRHHVLFDYAVATLLLLPMTATPPAYLRREQAAGLLLAPALGYWVEELKRTREDFWALVTDLVADEALDPVVRVEVARLAVEAVPPDEELTELTAILNETGERVARSFQQLAGALLTKAEAGQPFAGEPWAHLLGRLVLADSAQLGSLQALLGAVLNQQLGAGARASAGTAARALYARVAAQKRLTQWLAQRVIPHVVRTYSTDPEASRLQLSVIFSTERFERFGHLEVPVLAREVLALAAGDAGFTVELFARVFQGHNFSRNQPTPWGQGYIFALASNAAQDFELAKHHLAKAFPALLLQCPLTAVRAFAAMLRGKWDERDWRSKAAAQTSLSVGGILYRFEEDGSSMWAWELENGRHTAFAKIHEAFMQWIADIQNQQVLTALPGWLLGETPIALAWRVLFAAGVLHPQTLGLLLWPAASQQPALVSPSTQQGAKQLLAATYPHQALQTRREAEEQWLQWDFVAFADPASKRRGTLFPVLATIGETHLVTDAARDFLRSAQPAGKSLRNESSWTQRSRITESSGYEAEADESPAAPWRRLLTAVETARAQAQTEATPEAVAHLAEAVQALDQAASALPPDDTGGEECVTMLAESLATLVQLAGETAARTTALTRLLELTHHPAPATDAGTEAEFAAVGIQRLTRGRTDAATALASLVAIPLLWPRIAARFEALLLHDPHPEVRWRVLTALPELENVAEQALWDLAERFAYHEQHPALCQRGLSSLRHLVHLDPVRTEPLIIALTKRADSASPRNDFGAPLLVFLALDKALPASSNLLQTWVADYADREQQLISVLFAVQERFVLGYDLAAPGLAAVRTRALELVWSLSAAIEPALVAWTAANREPTAGEVTAVKLCDAVAEQLFFAVCADELPPSLGGVDAQRQFLRDYTPLIRKLSALGTPNAVHHLLEVLSRLVSANPAGCFDLFSEAILRTTGVAKYEHESLGAARFVELIGRYLADYQSIFKQPARQKRLIDCIAVFVEAGWPEARRLFYDLAGRLQ